jgi:hypothetical protein
MKLKAVLFAALLGLVRGDIEAVQQAATPRAAPEGPFAGTGSMLRGGEAFDIGKAHQLVERGGVGVNICPTQHASLSALRAASPSATKARTSLITTTTAGSSPSPSPVLRASCNT